MALAVVLLADLLPSPSERPPVPARLAASSSCELYPIALAATTLEGVGPGGIVADVANGSGPGNFGWLSWAGDNGVPALARSLTPPGSSST